MNSLGRQLSVVPYWRLSAFYFFYFALLGALLPYWALYLKSLSLSVIEIGQVMAVFMATKIISPNLWGYIADRTGRRMLVIRWGAALTTLTFSLVFLQPNFLFLLLIMALFTFFWNAILAQFEVVTLGYLTDRLHQYSKVRLWGSIGFVVAVWGLGLAFEVLDVQYLPVILVILMCCIWVSSLLVSDASIVDHDHQTQNGFLHQLFRPHVLLFFFICFLMQLSHGPFYTFYTLYLESFGYSKTMIGWLWALGVIAEVVVFFFMHRLMSGFRVTQLCVVSLLFAAVRWVLLAIYPESLLCMHVAQLFHAATFGVFHAVSIHMVQQYFTPKSAGQAQALYGALSFGAGGAVGSYVAGFMWEAWSPSSAYLMAAVICVVAAILAWWKLPRVAAE